MVHLQIHDNDTAFFIYSVYVPMNYTFSDTMNQMYILILKKHTTATWITLNLTLIQLNV